MKKFFSLVAAVLFAGSMFATEVTISPSDFTPVETSDYATIKDGVSVVVTKSTVTADQMRIFKTQSLTISSESYITKIVITCTAKGEAKYGPGCFAKQDGYSFDAEGNTGTWEGSATSVTFTAETNQVRATSIVVTLGAPAPEPAVRYYLVGSKIGWDPLPAYELKANPKQEDEWMIDATFEAGEGIKVLGVHTQVNQKDWYKDGMGTEYIVNEAGDYTLYFRPEGNEAWGYTYFEIIKKEVPGAISCNDVYSKAKGDQVVLNDVVVTYVNGKNVWVKDASASLLIYLSADATWKAGDVLSGVAGAVDIYNGVHEVKPSADQAAAVSAVAGTAPAAEALATVALTDVNKYIVLQNVEAEGEFEEGKASNITISGVVFRNQFKNGFKFEAGKKYDVYGVVTIYSNKPQVYFIEAKAAGEQGLNNTVVTGKTVKSMHNGVLVIEKNGVRYNAAGQIVK